MELGARRHPVDPGQVGVDLGVGEKNERRLRRHLEHHSRARSSSAPTSSTGRRTASSVADGRCTSPPRPGSCSGCSCAPGPGPSRRPGSGGSCGPDTHVGDGSLTVLVSELRSALGDGAREPRYIRTVQGFGYAFAAEATDVPPTSSGPGGGSLPRVVWGRRVLPLVEGDNVLGRDEDATIRIDDASVSRRHAVLRVRGDEATLEDLGSKNGTYLREKRVEASARLERATSSSSARWRSCSGRRPFREPPRRHRRPRTETGRGGFRRPCAPGLSAPLVNAVRTVFTLLRRDESVGGSVGGLMRGFGWARLGCEPEGPAG